MLTARNIEYSDLFFIGKATILINILVNSKKDNNNIIKNVKKNFLNDTVVLIFSIDIYFCSHRCQ